MRNVSQGDGVTLGVGRRRRLKRILSRQICGDIAAMSTTLTITLSAAIASLIPGVYGEISQYISLGLIAGVTTAILFHLGGYYEFDHLLKTWRHLRGLVWRWALVLLGLTAIAYIFGLTHSFSRRWFVAWAILGFAGIIIIRFTISYWLGVMTKDGGVLNRRIAIVGVTEIAAQFSLLMSDKRTGVTVTGIYDDRGPERKLSIDLPLTGNIDQLIERAMRGGVDDIVICLPWSAGPRIDEVFHRLAVLPVTTSVCPDLLWLNNVHGGISYMGNVPLLNIHKRPLEGWGGVLKSIEDRLVAGILLSALAPFMAIIALLIKLDSKGPVFFKQRRHGFSHDVFDIYKFRTMTVMENGDAVVQAQKGDQRITPLGAFLRRYSLDELPQLWNVLAGDMSLVGPRPHAVSHNHQYAQIIQDYAGRHRVKPGMTGWAQVNGLRGETATDDLMEDRVRYDLSYIENWSLLFDIRILLMTIWAVIFPRNAY